MDFQDLIFKLAQYLPGLLFAVTIHEFSHGWMAKKFGDDTADRAGRLTLNPIVHIDPMGTVIVPMILLFFGGFYGWAKPVPVNSRNFTNIKKGIFWVSFAGPLSNLITAAFSAFLLAILITQVGDTVLTIKKEMFERMLEFSLFINIIIACFNLLPFPGFDGSRMLLSYMSYNAQRKYEEISGYLIYAFYGLIIMSFAGVDVFGPVFMPFIKFGYFLRAFFIQILM